MLFKTSLLDPQWAHAPHFLFAFRTLRNHSVSLRISLTWWLIAEWRRLCHAETIRQIWKHHQSWRMTAWACKIVVYPPSMVPGVLAELTSPKNNAPRPHWQDWLPRIRTTEQDRVMSCRPDVLSTYWLKDVIAQCRLDTHAWIDESLVTCMHLYALSFNIVYYACR